MQTAYIKPVGGLKRVAVVPAGTTVADSPQEIASQVVALPLMEDGSVYEEILQSEDGVLIVCHRLTLTLARDVAQREVTERVAVAWSREGTAALVETLSGERLIVGWSERWQHEQPLRLVKMESTTALSPAEIPTARLIFESYDDSSAQSLT